MEFTDVSKYEVQEGMSPFDDVSTAMAYEECINRVLTKPSLPRGTRDADAAAAANARLMHRLLREPRESCVCVLF